MGELSIWHLLIILFVILMVFGPGRLPGLGNSLGKAIRGFKEGIRGLDAESEEREAKSPSEQLSTSQKTSEETDKKKTTQS